MDRALALPRAVIDEVRETALEEAVAVHGAHDLLRAVHAVDADDERELLARRGLVREMQIAGRNLPLPPNGIS
jgi:hypothetical protein